MYVRTLKYGFQIFSAIKWCFLFFCSDFATNGTWDCRRHGLPLVEAEVDRSPRSRGQELPPHRRQHRQSRRLRTRAGRLRVRILPTNLQRNGPGQVDAARVPPWRRVRVEIWRLVLRRRHVGDGDARRGAVPRHEARRGGSLHHQRRRETGNPAELFGNYERSYGHVLETLPRWPPLFHGDLSPPGSLRKRPIPQHRLRLHGWGTRA